MGAHGGYHQVAAESYQRVAANLADAGAGGEALPRVLTAWIEPKKG